MREHQLIQLFRRRKEQKGTKRITRRTPVRGVKSFANSTFPNRTFALRHLLLNLCSTFPLQTFANFNGEHFPLLISTGRFLTCAKNLKGEHKTQAPKNYEKNMSYQGTKIWLIGRKTQNIPSKKTQG